MKGSLKYLQTISIQVGLHRLTRQSKHFVGNVWIYYMLLRTYNIHVYQES